MKKITPLILIAFFCISLVPQLTITSVCSESTTILPASPTTPSAEIDEGQEVLIPVWEDETVANSSPYTNWDGSQSAGGLYVGMEVNDESLSRSFLKFDLRNYPANLGYHAAYLYVYLNAEYLVWADQDVPIGTYYSSDDSWSEKTITWNNQPSFNVAPTDVIDYPASPDMFDPGNWYAWDITGDVAATLAGDGVLTEVLRITDEVTPSSCWKYFTEYEYDDVYSAYIALEYNEPVATNLALNGDSESPYTDYVGSPAILTWDIEGDGPNEGQRNYDIEVYDEPGTAGNLVYSDSQIQPYTVFDAGGLTNTRPFGTSSEMRFQFKYGDDLITRSGVIDKLLFETNTESATISFENISIYMLSVNNTDALGLTFVENYNGSLPTPVFHRELYQAHVVNYWIEFDIDNFFYVNERSSLIIEFRWSDKALPDVMSLHTTGASGSVAYAYGPGASTSPTADYAYDRTHNLKVAFLSEVVSSDGPGLNSYPFGTPAQGVFQLKYNKSLISETGIIDKLYFSTDSFSGVPILENLKIWMAETPVEGPPGTTLADNYGGATPVLVLDESTYEARNLGHTIEFDIDNVFQYTGEHDLLIEIRYSSRTGDNIKLFRTYPGGAYRAGNTADYQATTTTFLDQIAYDLDISFARPAMVDLTDFLTQGEYYYARVRPCDTTGYWGEWSDEIGFRIAPMADIAGQTYRVAIYDESDTTPPSWTLHGGTSHNNATGMQDILRSYGYDVALLTTEDIQNHMLMTGSYDVFVLVDNLPRDSIVNYVKEFCLGGGGILALDGSAQFLSYIGALPSEAANTDGYGYWSYSSDDFNITTISPVTRGYSLGDSVVTGSGFFAWNVTALEQTSVADEIAILGRKLTDQNWSTALGFDPQESGGRAVTIAVDLWHHDEMPLYQMFADAIEWLAPKPKARIAYDLSHHPYYCADTWDGAYVHYIGEPRQAALRDTLVSRGYTFDKFYPRATGNLTVERLSAYDLLILTAPAFNFTLDEVEALRTWTEAGGSLMMQGEQYGFDTENAILNYLMYSLGIDVQIYINVADYPLDTVVEFYDHPVMENVDEIMFSGGSYVNVTGDATSLAHLGSDMVSAVQEVGSGRIYASADINTFANYIAYSNNTQHVVNLVNWLTSGNTHVLAFVDSTEEIDPNDNIYRGPVADALNSLGIDFYMTTNRTYFEMCLDLYDWGLVVVDGLEDTLSSTSHSKLLEFMDSGGRLVISSESLTSAHPLWSYLGVQEATGIVTAPQQYVWDTAHPIFEVPVDFGASSLTSSFTPIPPTQTAFNLSLYSNATALAGTTASPAAINVGIAEGAGGRAIINGLLLTLYSDDADLSGYADGFEIWLNEIAYVLKPRVNSPADIAFEIGNTGNEFTWAPTSPSPWRYSIEVDSVQVEGGFWYGTESFSFNVDSYPEGVYSFLLSVWDTRGELTSDEVIVTSAVDLTAPELNSPANVFYMEGESGNSITWIASDLHQDTYVVLVNGTAQSGYPAEWNTTSIVVNVDGLAAGSYNYTVVVSDAYGNSASDEVIVIVVASTTTTTTGTTTTTPTTPTAGTTPPFPGDILLIVVVILGCGAAIVVVILIMKRRGAAAG